MPRPSGQVARRLPPPPRLRAADAASGTAQAAKPWRGAALTVGLRLAGSRCSIGHSPSRQAMARRSAYCRAAFGRQQMHHRARPKPPSRPRSTTTVSGTPRAFSSAFSVCSARRGAAPTVGLRAAGGRCCRFAVTVAAAFRTGCETASTATAVVWIRDCAALSPTWNAAPTGTVQDRRRGPLCRSHYVAPARLDARPELAAYAAAAASANRSTAAGFSAFSFVRRGAGRSALALRPPILSTFCSAK